MKDMLRIPKKMPMSGILKMSRSLQKLSPLMILKQLQLQRKMCRTKSSSLRKHLRNNSGIFFKDISKENKCFMISEDASEI